jgi:hypothetical protein
MLQRFDNKRFVLVMQVRVHVSCTVFSTPSSGFKNIRQHSS